MHIMYLNYSKRILIHTFQISSSWYIFAPSSTQLNDRDYEANRLNSIHTGIRKFYPGSSIFKEIYIDYTILHDDFVSCEILRSLNQIPYHLFTLWYKSWNKTLGPYTNNIRGQVRNFSHFWCMLYMYSFWLWQSTLTL